MLSVLWSGNSAAGRLLPSRTLSGVQGARPPDAAAAGQGDAVRPPLGPSRPSVPVTALPLPHTVRGQTVPCFHLYGAPDVGFNVLFKLFKASLAQDQEVGA